MAIMNDGPNFSDIFEPLRHNTADLVKYARNWSKSLYIRAQRVESCRNRARACQSSMARALLPKSGRSSSMDPGQSSWVHFLLLHDTQKHRCWLAGFALVLHSAQKKRITLTK